MKFVAKSVIIFGFIALTTQDITKKNGCDCRICQVVDNGIANPLVGRKFKEEEDDGGGKPGCSLCERKKEMLRMERERQEQRQKCPFEILGSPAIKGKTSEEIFDEFRELIVPSQNGFFDMMRGIVKTMHVSTEAELKSAQEKEARELAKKKAEEAKKRVEAAKQAARKARPPEDPKVTVVLKQTPCQQFLATGTHTKDSPLTRFFKKSFLEERNPIPNTQLVDSVDKVGRNPISDLQVIDFPEKSDRNHLGLDASKNSGNEDLIPTELLTTVPPRQAKEVVDGLVEGPAGAESSTESPFVKFLTDEEFKAQSRREDVSGGLGFNLLEGNFLHSPPKEQQL